MSLQEFSMSTMVILVTMGLAALIEIALPLFPRSAAQRRRHGANLGMTAVTLLFNWVLTSAAAFVALALSLQGPGWFSRLGLPMLAQVAFSVVVLDFFYGYVAHRAMHMSPLLWRIHRVHHSDSFVDVTTAYRNHPMEGLWRYLFMIVPVWMIGIPAEAVLAYRLLSAINAALEHANIRLWFGLDRALSAIWVTPNAHKVHHSRDQVETDSNFGNILSIYDRALGTFTPTERALTVVYGLDDVEEADNLTLGSLLAMPFRSNPTATVVKRPAGLAV
jgi:sterol desaturase/sphingolipid hydroxylase (fatty acid hydroxylase superfamily)